MVQALQANIDWKSPFFEVGGSLWPKISGRRGRSFVHGVRNAVMARYVSSSFNYLFFGEVGWCGRVVSTLINERYYYYFIYL